MRQRNIKQYPCRTRAFTLMEILVAVSVLALLIFMVGQIVHSGSALISGSRKHLGADAQAREVFSRFDLDLKAIPRRQDMELVLSSKNNAIYFFCEGPGFHTSTDPARRSTLALVGYRINPGAQLERLGKGLAWEDSLFLTYSTSKPDATSVVPESTMNTSWSDVIGSAPEYSGGTDEDYRVLAEGVFRFVYFFQMKDGSYTLNPPQDPAYWRLKDVAAVVLTVAVLDGESAKLVKDRSGLGPALPDPLESDLAAEEFPVKKWQEAVDNTAQFASAAGIPLPAAARVRIYQRSFSLGGQ